MDGHEVTSSLRSWEATKCTSKPRDFNNTGIPFPSSSCSLPGIDPRPFSPSLPRGSRPEKKGQQVSWHRQT